jgi:sucrose-phosphate synthase
VSLAAAQAAAHGVPTVATKNGGPVDIMATLHHGLLVDPTNSKQIAEALLKILTNPEVWDEMSHNGARARARLRSGPAHAFAHFAAAACSAAQQPADLGQAIRERHALSRHCRDYWVKRSVSVMLCTAS